MCFGIIDIVPMVEPNEAKFIDYISAYMNMKYLYGKIDSDGISSEESWNQIEHFLPLVY
jgi:hypothetical protein